jgi:signal transduction histidine kinase
MRRFYFARSYSPLLYAEWLLLSIGLLRQFCWPADALSILMSRRLATIEPADQYKIALGLDYYQFGGIVTMLILGAVLCWKLPRSNKRYIVGILLIFFMPFGLLFLPIGSKILTIGLYGWFWVSFGIFAGLGLQVKQQNVLVNKLLYGFGEFLLIWEIFFVSNGLSAGGSLTFELLLILHLVAIIRACVMFENAGRWWVVAAFFCSYHIVSIEMLWLWPRVMSAHKQSVLLTPEDTRNALNAMAFNVSVGFTLLTGMVVLWVNALVTERRSREKLAVANEQLRQYADRATFAERNRIAREIHDSLGHSLTAQSIQLENALLFLESDSSQAQHFLSQAHSLSQTALAEVRQSVQVLRDDAFGDIPLAIQLLIQGLIDQHIQVEYVECLTFFRLPTQVKIAIYRIIQESFTNIIKHSKADQVRLCFQVIDEILRIAIYDNGQGFDMNQNTTGFGLRGMLERADELDAQLLITSSPNQGCRIELLLPLEIWLLSVS